MGECVYRVSERKGPEGKEGGTDGRGSRGRELDQGLQQSVVIILVRTNMKHLARRCKDACEDACYHSTCTANTALNCTLRNDTFKYPPNAGGMVEVLLVERKNLGSEKLRHVEVRLDEP